MLQQQTQATNHLQHKQKTSLTNKESILFEK